MDQRTLSSRLAMVGVCVLGIGVLLSACGAEETQGSPWGGGLTGSGGSSSGGSSPTTTTTTSLTDTVDDDGDGYSEAQGDCNDGNDAVHPGATEVCDNGIDDNCNGATDSAEPDGDGDGFGPCGGDCNDSDPDVSPAEPEVPDDGIDNNCDGAIDGDFDGDGFSVADGDCDDGDADVYPGAPEICWDGADNDCDGFTDAEEPDADVDGWGPCQGDCDDNDPNVNPGMEEVPGNNVDDNCDNLVDDDVDGDGWSVANGDCDDFDPDVNPSILEICGNTIDDDCDGTIDTDCLTACEIAAIQRSSVGCQYYAYDTNPLRVGSYAVVVSNVDPTVTANVLIEAKSGGVWNTVSNGSFTVGPMSLVSRTLTRTSANGSLIQVGGAYRITSDLPVIAYQFSPIDGSSSYLSDASLLLPTSSLDHYYIVPAWPYGADIGNTWRPAHLQVIASGSTDVTITSPIATVAGTGLPSLTPGVPSGAIHLEEGDALQLTVLGQNQSFAGAYIEAVGAPVSVFTSNDCANVPLGAGNCCCDHLEEQIFGLQTWGTRYVASRSPVRAAEPSVWQVLAQEDDTVVHFDFAATVTGLPAQVTLSAREKVDYTVNGPAGNPGDFYAWSDKPFLITQYTVGCFTVQYNGTNGDPAMIQAVPVEQFLSQYVILVPNTWVNDYVVLTRSQGETVNIDGTPVTTGWVQAGTSGFEVTRVSVADGVHTLTGTAPFGVVAIGWDDYDSYGYPGGLDQQIINPMN